MNEGLHDPSHYPDFVPEIWFEHLTVRKSVKKGLSASRLYELRARMDNEI